MNAIYYIGLDIHEKRIAYCIKKIDGTLVRQGGVTAGWAFMESDQDNPLIFMKDHPTKSRYLVL